jgi:hypothetical protein
MRIMRLELVLLVVAMAAGMLLADDKSKTAPAAPSVTNPAFEKIKGLVGDWEGKTPDGKAYGTTFRLVSGGSAVLITTVGEEDMITVVHPDGPALMATHYCAAKNQPRFVAEPSSDPNVIRFKMKDITNLASPDAPHMSAAVFTIVDHDHYKEAWTWVEGGKEQVFSMELTRKK